ncbi:hypothetical protein SNEBB_000968 [Seison nebaliae]|nr:hypothetical protein SNEBB_000968 [Seison nebaliae]
MTKTRSQTDALHGDHPDSTNKNDTNNQNDEMKEIVKKNGEMISQINRSIGAMYEQLMEIKSKNENNNDNKSKIEETTVSPPPNVDSQIENNIGKVIKIQRNTTLPKKQCGPTDIYQWADQIE